MYIGPSGGGTTQTPSSLGRTTTKTLCGCFGFERMLRIAPPGVRAPHTRAGSFWELRQTTYGAAFCPAIESSMKMTLLVLSASAITLPFIAGAQSSNPTSAMTDSAAVFALGKTNRAGISSEQVKKGKTPIARSNADTFRGICPNPKHPCSGFWYCPPDENRDVVGAPTIECILQESFAYLLCGFHGAQALCDALVRNVPRQSVAAQ